MHQAAGHLMQKSRPSPVWRSRKRGWHGQQHRHHTQLKVVGNGRTILNNKGKPVKQYEPYFSTIQTLKMPKNWWNVCKPIITYDSAGRVIRTDLPDGTFTKVTFDAWKQQTLTRTIR